MLRGTGTLTFPENRLSLQPTQQPLHSNVYLIGKEMFISAESASKRNQLQQASPAITKIGGGSTPTETAITP
jgi:hypothetical protein